MAENRVLIAGGGMIGAALALALGRRGWQVTLVERETPQLPATVPLRVSAFNPQSVAFLERLGVWPAIEAHGIQPYRELQVAEGDQSPACFRASEQGVASLGAFVANDAVQYALWQALALEPAVALHAGTTVTSLLAGNEPGADRVSVQLASGETLTADLLIIAEGGQSPLRAKAGMGVDGWDYRQGCLAVTLALESDAGDTTWQCFTPSGPRAYLPLWHQQASLVWYDDLAHLKRQMTLGDDALLAAFRAAYPRVLPQAKVVARACFPLRRQHAQHYVRGRTLVVGDAAHLINPLAGLGANLGFADISYLADTLAETTPAALDGVLRRYALWRWPQNLAVMSLMDGCYRLFSNDVPWVRSARQGLLSVLARCEPVRRAGLALASHSLDERLRRAGLKV